MGVTERSLDKRILYPSRARKVVAFSWDESLGRGSFSVKGILFAILH